MGARSRLFGRNFPRRFSVTSLCEGLGRRHGGQARGDLDCRFLLPDRHPSDSTSSTTTDRPSAPGSLRGSDRVTVRTWSRAAMAVIAVPLVTPSSTTGIAVRSARPASGTLTTVAIGPTTNLPFRATVVVDGARPGPVFQGIGAISGGGGNSRLLIDYPPGERAEILDYLFSPHYGASLQMLKLEIGGGGFSSDGSEPSVEPVQGQLDCGAGYEFWLARQAVERNPAIKLYGLQWTAPAWVRGPLGGLWNTTDVGYVVDWLRCARQQGLTISYVGGWNEHYQGTAAEQAWFVNLRAALDAAGFSGTEIVAA